MNIKQRVANLVKKYDSCDPYILTRDLGIKVIPLELPESIRGFYVRILRRKFIAVNAALPEISQKVVVCHELGHARLHPGYGYYYTLAGTHFISCRRETEANEFALHLLSRSHDIDLDLVQKLLRDKRPDPREVHQILSSVVSPN